MARAGLTEAYLFAEEGIVALPMIPIYYVVVPVCVTGILGIFSGGGPIAVVLWWAFGLGVLTPLVSFFYIRKRRRLESYRLEELRGRKGVRIIPWTSVTDLKIKGKRVKIKASGWEGRAVVDSHDSEQFNEFVQGKLPPATGER